MMPPPGHTCVVTAGDWVAVVAGAALAGTTLVSALRTVVLPQGGLTNITRFMFALSDRLFTSHNTKRFRPRRLSGLYAPVALVSLPFAWSMLVALGFAFIFWGLGVGSFSDAWITSGSSLFTLGFARPEGADLILLTFIEATIGLGLVALLISYLPTLYMAYSAREQGVGLLAPLTGTPPSASELLWRLDAAHALEGLSVWGPASTWFVAVDQSHSAFPALSRFPPQHAEHSWVAMAGAVLDAAAVRLSIVEEDEGPPPPGGVHRAGHRDELGPVVLTLAHGIPAMGRIAEAAGLPVDSSPALVELVLDTGSPEPEISVTREEYEQAVAFLTDTGVIGAVDVERSWPRFARARSGYDVALRGLAGLTHAPTAPWTTDRALHVGRPPFFSHRPMTMER
jgi:hypothetical protein